MVEGRRRSGTVRFLICDAASGKNETGAHLATRTRLID
jgi:hypothetical protein